MVQGCRFTSVPKCAHARIRTPQLSRRAFLSLSAATACSACVPKALQGTSDVLVFGREGFREGALLYPRAIGVHRGRVHVVDKSGRLQRFTLDGEFIDGWRLPEQDNGTPTAIAFAGDLILVPDTHNSRILKYDDTGTLVDKWGAYGFEPGKFVYPTGLTVGPDGHYYISEYGTDAERIQVFHPDGRLERWWGKAGQEPGAFSRAMAIAMDTRGRIHVADTGNHRIQVFDLAGESLGVLANANGDSDPLAFPFDIALAPDDSLLVIDYGTHRLSRFDAEGEYLGTYGRPGRAPGRFHAPRGVAVAREEEWIYVADTGNHRIQRIPLEAVS